MDSDDESSSTSVERVPACLEWTVQEVADWIEKLGYKEYKVNHNRFCVL